MRGNRVLSAIVALIVAASLTVAPAGDPARAAAGSPPTASGPAEVRRGGPVPPHCQALTFPVAMTEGGPADQRIAGTLCLPRHGQARTLQLLIPGGTYGQAYWFLRGQWRQPSYVETMTGAGYAVLAIDRLGAGRSSAPPFDRYAPDTQQAVMAQLVDAVHAGEVTGRDFDSLVLVGHSYGSTLARTIAIHHPARLDGLILTGEASAQSELPWDEVIHPALEDPKFASRGLDPAYYTTRPGARGTWFYHRPNAHRWVIALDELTKQADVYSEEYPLPEENAAIQVPVLIVVGQQDALICGEGGSDCTSSQALQQQEDPWYPNASLRVEVVARTGHALNLHRSAPQWMSMARDWLDRSVGTG